MSNPKRRLMTGLCAFALTGIADAKPRVRFAGDAVGAGYGYYGGFPYFSPFYYDSFYYGFAPFHPGYFSGFGYGPGLGEVKPITSGKAGEVFLDGAYAGEAAKLKSMWLDPGAYNLEIKNAGRSIYERRIYVLTGKTLRIHAGDK